MMKLFKRAACVAVAGAMLLMTACGGGGSSSGSGGSGPNANPTGTKGRYVETDITPEAMGAEDGFFLFRGQENALVCFSPDLATRWDSADGGKTWSQSEGPGAALPELAGCRYATMLEDGSLIVALPVGEGYSMENALYKVSPGGEMTPFALEGYDDAAAEGKSPYVSELEALPGGRLFAQWGTGGNMGYVPGTEIEGDLPGGEGDEPDADNPDEGEPGDEPDDAGMNFNMGAGSHHSGLYDSATGSLVSDLSNSYILGIGYDDEALYMADYEGKVTARSLENGAELTDKQTAFPTQDMQFSLLLASDGAGSVYGLDSMGLHKSADGGAPETLLDPAAYSFGNPNAWLVGFHALPDGSFLVALDEGNGARLYRYEWDENATVDPAKTLRVWSLEDNATVRAAIAQFRRKNPDATVLYEVGVGPNSNTTVDDAIKNLNTRLLANDAPDVLILDGTPVETYAEKGMLKNLADIVDTSGLYATIADAFKGDNGMYYLPARVRLPLLMGDEGTLGSLNTLDALLGAVNSGNGAPPTPADANDLFNQLPAEQRPELSFDNLNEWADMLWKASSANVVKNNELDSDALRRFLAALKELSDKYGLANIDEDAAPGAMMAVSIGNSGSSLTGSPIAYNSQRANLGAFTADSLNLLSFLLDMPGSGLTTFPGLTEGAWLPSTITGISAGTGVPELAAEFVNTLLSPEVQKTYTTGLPVLRQGLEEQVKDLDEMMRKNAEAMGQENPKGFSYDFEPLYASLKTPVLTEQLVTDKVLPVAISYCKGEIDLEGAVSKIEQDIRNYLAERS